MSAGDFLLSQPLIIRRTTIGGHLCGAAMFAPAIGRWRSFRIACEARLTGTAAMSSNLPTLQALLARVEGGEENRALDVEIALHLSGGSCRYCSLDDAWHFKWQADCEWEPLPHFLSSFDAAVGLCERVRPGWGRMILKGAVGPRAFASLFPPGPDSIKYNGEAGDEPRALIAALIQAEIAKAQERQP